MAARKKKALPAKVAPAPKPRLLASATADDAIVVGREAQELAQNPAFRRMLSDGKKGVLDAIAVTRPDESTQREFLYRLARCFDFLEPVLLVAINGGVHAAADAARAAAKAAAKAGS